MKNGSLLPDYHRLDISVHHMFNLEKAKVILVFQFLTFTINLISWYYEYNFAETICIVKRKTTELF